MHRKLCAQLYELEKVYKGMCWGKFGQTEVSQD